MTALLNFWPDAARCDECLKTEAENPADAVFLAVHQPTRLTRRAFGAAAGATAAVTEGDALEALLGPAPEGRVILPILGDSGAGKSHLVRWLDVKLRTRGDAAGRHVIRIPKGASLKSVLGLALADLPGGRFDALRDKLRGARERLDRVGAEERIRSELVAALRRRHIQATEAVRDAREKSEQPDPAEKEWAAFAAPQALPAVLNDVSAGRLFMEGAPDRPGLIAQLARHLTVDTAPGEPDEAPRKRFEAADFVVPDGPAGAALGDVRGDAAPAVQRWLDIFATDVGGRRTTAVRLLNELIDGALAPLAQPTDGTLSELFFDVRRELHREGRELVLLVEDFAVLAGVQGALLDAIIKEGVRDGERTACTIRTALAVTTGYPLPDTVRTRAWQKSGWYVDEAPDADPAAAHDRAARFLGAYLNAARFGADRLRELAADRAAESGGAAPEGGPPDFRDHATPTDADRAVLDAFGRSGAGHDLFPLNAAAVRELVDWKFRAGGAPKFTPRELISQILRPILREYRGDHEAGRFPPPEFLDFNPNDVPPAAREELRQTHRDPDAVGRLLPALRFWAGNPDRPAEAELPAAVFETFGLPPLGAGGTPAPARSQTTPAAPAAPAVARRVEAPGARPDVSVAPAPAPPGDEPDAPDWADEAETWADRLTAWQRGVTLLQTPAKQLRGWVAESVLAHLDWDAELLNPWKATGKEAGALPAAVFIPNARGGYGRTEEDAAVVICSAERFAEEAGPVSLALGAVVRHHLAKGWEYDGAEDDYARYVNFLDARRGRAAAWVRRHYRKGIGGEPVATLAQALHVGGRLLNVDGAHGQPHADAIRSVFAQAPPPDDGDEPGGPGGGGSKWDRLRREHREVRPELRDALLDRLAARQGGAATVQAVDAAALAAALAPLRRPADGKGDGAGDGAGVGGWRVRGPLTGPAEDDATRRMQSHVRDLGRGVGPALTGRRTEVLEEVAEALAAFGDDFQKDTVADALKGVIDRARPLGLTADAGAGPLEAGLAEFRKRPVAECLRRAAAIRDAAGDDGGDGPDNGKLASALARLDAGTLAFTAGFARDAAAFLTQLEKAVDGAAAADGGVSVEVARDDFDGDLQALGAHAAPGGGTPGEGMP